MKKIALFCLVAVIGNTAFANSCLYQVSNAELVSELSRRLGGNSSPVPPSANLEVSALCAGSLLKIDVWSAANNTSGQASVDVVYSAECNKYRNAINQKARALTAGGRVAACSGSFLTTFLLSTNGSIKTTTQDMVYSSDCQNQAALINR